MFGPITIPFGAKMLFNTVKLKAGVDMDDVDVAIAEMCSVVKKPTVVTKVASSPGKCSASRDSFPMKARWVASRRPITTLPSSPTGAHSMNMSVRMQTRCSARSSRLSPACRPAPRNSATT